MTHDMIAHLTRQAAFSRATFGPGPRTKGVQDHIVKEFQEINELTDEADRSQEWVDVAILALDGLLRSVASAHPMWTYDMISARTVEMIAAKQGKNERRNWPDWRTAPSDKALEHNRGTED